jgi:aquaglyceroporin related protein
MNTAQTHQTNRTDGLQDGEERLERKREPTVEIDNEYFSFNPWYNQQKDKPVFGLAAPLPRTVRRGMLWGRGDLRKSLYKVDKSKEDDGIAPEDGLDMKG